MKTTNTIQLQGQVVKTQNVIDKSMALINEYDCIIKNTYSNTLDVISGLNGIKLNDKVYATDTITNEHQLYNYITNIKNTCNKLVKDNNVSLRYKIPDYINDNPKQYLNKLAEKCNDTNTDKEVELITANTIVELYKNHKFTKHIGDFMCNYRYKKAKLDELNELNDKLTKLTNTLNCYTNKPNYSNYNIDVTAFNKLHDDLVNDYYEMYMNDKQTYENDVLTNNTKKLKTYKSWEIKLYTGSNDDILKECNYQANYLVNDLISRIKNTAGNILGYKQLHFVGKALNGYVIGDKCTVKLTTIIASGDIQCTHYRVLVKKVKSIDDIDD